MPPKAPIAGARLDEQVGDGFGRFAIENEIDFTIPLGPPLNRAAFPDQLYNGELDRLTALAQCLSRYLKRPAECGRRSDYGRLGQGAGERGGSQGAVRLDDEPASARAAHRSCGFVGRAHHSNRRAEIFTLVVGS